MIVLDASALLALMFREEGHERVADFIDQGLMSTVNRSEVLGRFARDGRDLDRVSKVLDRTAIRWIDFSIECALEAAKLIPRTHELGLSLGDRACLALGAIEGLPVVTADRAWLALDLPIEIQAIR